MLGMPEHWPWLTVPELYRIEWIYLGALILLSCLLPRRSWVLSSLTRALHRLANKRRAAVLTVVLVVLVGRLALVGSLGIPRPGVPDEFGYLLTADTFAHGRMSNPTPPMWKSLETFNVIQSPSYQSQYPIGYPALLALAQVVFKNPWWAVYLVTAFMCGAITWMLQVWMPPLWALLGGLFVALRFGLFSYWMNSFWGGSLPALGGALVFGAMPRLTERIGRSRGGSASMLGASMLLGLGVVILASTRPYEGLVVCLPMAIIFVQWLSSQSGPRFRHALCRGVAPCILILGAAAAMMLYDQYQVTGHPLQSPYDVALKQIHAIGPFVFQKPLPTPHYDNIEMRLLYVHYAAQFADKMHDPYGFWQIVKERFAWYWQFFVGPLMTLPLLASITSLRDRNLRVVWMVVSLLTIAVLVENWIQLHYLAPGFCLFVLLLLEGGRRLKVLRIGRYALGSRIVRALPVVCVLLLGLRVFAFNELDESVATHWPPNWAYGTLRLPQREQVEDALRASPGQHLVLVRYRYPFHNIHHEWVFNGADLPSSKILWARSMDVNQNCAFVHLYEGRKLWIVDEWGDVSNFEPISREEVCNPSNRIYEPNHQFGYYYSRIQDSRRAVLLRAAGAQAHSQSPHQ